MSQQPQRARRRDELLDDVERAMEAGRWGRAEKSLVKAADLSGADDPEVLYLGAQLSWARDGAKAALPGLRRAVEQAPDAADYHYALALCCEELGDRDGMIEHFLSTRKLDAAIDAQQGLGTEQQVAWIQGVAEQVLGKVPPGFRERMANVPVVLEARPSEEDVREGFDPRALGKFDGLPDSVHGRTGDAILGGDLPETKLQRIVLYVCSHLAAFDDDDDLVEQIEVTLLHEIAHFFDLDEDDVARLGLE